MGMVRRWQGQSLGRWWGCGATGWCVLVGGFPIGHSGAEMSRDTAHGAGAACPGSLRCVSSRTALDVSALQPRAHTSFLCFRW